MTIVIRPLPPPNFSEQPHPTTGPRREEEMESFDDAFAAAMQQGGAAEETRTPPHTPQSPPPTEQERRQAELTTQHGGTAPGLEREEPQAPENTAEAKPAPDHGRGSASTGAPSHEGPSLDDRRPQLDGRPLHPHPASITPRTVKAGGTAQGAKPAEPLELAQAPQVAQAPEPAQPKLAEERRPASLARTARFLQMLAAAAKPSSAGTARPQPGASPALDGTAPTGSAAASTEQPSAASTPAPPPASFARTHAIPLVRTRSEWVAEWAILPPILHGEGDPAAATPMPHDVAAGTADPTAETTTRHGIPLGETLPASADPLAARAPAATPPPEYRLLSPSQEADRQATRALRALELLDVAGAKSAESLAGHAMTEEPAGSAPKPPAGEATRVAFSEGYRRSAGTPAPASSTQAAESPNESQLPKPDPHAAQPVDGRSRIVEQRAADDPRTPAATRNLGRPGVNVIDSPARRSGRHAGATTTAQAASGPASPRTFDQATPVPMAPNGSQSARAIDAANGLALTKASGADPATPPAEPNLEAASTMPGRPITIDLRGDGGIDGHLRLTVRGESVQAAIYSANPETVRRLGTDLNELQRSLADRGFSAAKVSVHQMAQAAPAAADSQPGRQDDTPHDRRANDGDGSRRGHDPAEGRGKRENRGDHEGHEWRGGHEVRDGREVREWRGARHQER